jgi:hypothetical protein
MMGLGIALAASGLAGTLAVTGLAATGATAAETGDGAGEPRHRLVTACARVPHAVERTERLQARLAGDAETRGSLAFLEDRIARATQAGHDDVATVLTARLEFRRELAGILPSRLEYLAVASDVCAEHDAKPAST